MSWVVVWLFSWCFEGFWQQVKSNDAVCGHSITPIPTYHGGSYRLTKTWALVSQFGRNRRGNLSFDPRDTIDCLTSPSANASKCRPSLHPRKWTALRESPWGKPRNRESPRAPLSTALKALQLSSHRCPSSKVRKRMKGSAALNRLSVMTSVLSVLLALQRLHTLCSLLAALQKTNNILYGLQIQLCTSLTQQCSSRQKNTRSTSCGDISKYFPLMFFLDKPSGKVNRNASAEKHNCQCTYHQFLVFGDFCFLFLNYCAVIVCTGTQNNFTGVVGLNRLAEKPIERVVLNSRLGQS